MARILDVDLDMVRAAAPSLPRCWNISTGEWWLTEEHLGVWKRYFGPKPPPLPIFSTRTLQP